MCLLVLVLAWPLSRAGNAQDFVTLVNRVTPSVAFVLTRDDSGQPETSGTAFEIGNGVLLTALHVVQSATQISVQFPGQPATRADVIGIDIDHDVALLTISTSKPAPPPLALGNSNDVQLGEPVAVVGYPLAEPEQPSETVTQGIVSALRTKPTYIQIDASINPGNSGGPVLAPNGRVIGVVDAQLRGAQNFNFAVPIDLAKPLIGRAGTRTPLPLPLTTPTDVKLMHSGNSIGPHEHEEKEGASCVDPPQHAAAIVTVQVEMHVQKPLHMVAWLSWTEGAGPESEGTFGQMDDTVSPELVKPLKDLDLMPKTVCLNYIAWNNTDEHSGRNFSVQYTVTYRVFNVPSTVSGAP